MLPPGDRFVHLKQSKPVNILVEDRGNPIKRTSANQDPLNRTRVVARLAQG
jgi:hypothetical protein